MGWVGGLDGCVVGIDTSPFIYYFEENENYIDELRPFFKAVDSGSIQLLTSTITLLEVLVHPLRQGDEQLVREYRDILLRGRNIFTRSVNIAIAASAAELRATYGLKTPDSIQLATAINGKATVFLTNDRDFPDMETIDIINLKAASAAAV